MSHGSGSGGGHHSGGEGGGGPQGNFHYAVGDNFNPLGSYRLEHFTEGLRINNGIRFGLLFLAFFGWLYIVYWLRHHEPLSQQSIGMNAPVAPTAKQDKSLVASITNAFPFKTSPETETLYAPTPQSITKSSPYYQPENGIEPLAKVKTQKGAAGEAFSAPITYMDRDFDERFGQPAYPATNPSASRNGTNEPLISNYVPTYRENPSDANVANINSLSPSYNIPVHNGNCVSLRTVVNR